MIGSGKPVIEDHAPPIRHSTEIPSDHIKVSRLTKLPAFPDHFLVSFLGTELARQTRLSLLNWLLYHRILTSVTDKIHR
jgi:hypothetical protein